VVFAWQSGHRPIQRAYTYGLDGAFPDSLQPALLRVYKWVSSEWHRFLQLEQSKPAPPLPATAQSPACPQPDNVDFCEPASVAQFARTAQPQTAPTSQQPGLALLGDRTDKRGADALLPPGQPKKPRLEEGGEGHPAPTAGAFLDYTPPDDSGLQPARPLLPESCSASRENMSPTRRGLGAGTVTAIAQDRNDVATISQPPILAASQRNTAQGLHVVLFDKFFIQLPAFQIAICREHRGAVTAKSIASHVDSQHSHLTSPPWAHRSDGVLAVVAHWPWTPRQSPTPGRRGYASLTLMPSAKGARKTPSKRPDCHRPRKTRGGGPEYTSGRPRDRVVEPRFQDHRELFEDESGLGFDVQGPDRWAMSRRGTPRHREGQIGPAPKRRSGWSGSVFGFRSRGLWVPIRRRCAKGGAQMRQGGDRRKKQ
jgi:hypothetical protein